jgi:hypothetical protein
VTPEIWAVYGTAVFGIFGVLATLWQKHRSELRAQREQREQWARAEWWARVQWGMEQVRDNDPIARRSGLLILRGMATSDLATTHEREIIVGFLESIARLIARDAIAALDMQQGGQPQ